MSASSVMFTAHITKDDDSSSSSSTTHYHSSVILYNFTTLLPTMTNLAKAASILFGLTSAVSARSTPSAFVSGAKAFQSTSLNAAPDQKLPVMAEESIMAPKAHGSSEKAVMKDLKWDCDYNTADKICNFNRCVYSFIHIYVSMRNNNE